MKSQILKISPKLKKVINDSYSKKTLEKLSSFNETSKLYIYSKIKSELKLENYLLFFSNFKMIQLFTKFRVSDHSLEIESGRYKNITREERICKNCNLNEIGDEYHFFLKCTANHSLRNNLFNKIILNKPDFIEEIPLNKIMFLLNSNSELFAEVGDFIKQSTELQIGGPCRSKVWHVKNIMLVNRIYFVYPILWSNCNFLCFLCFVCLYLYLLDPHGCIMQIKNYYYYKKKTIVKFIGSRTRAYLSLT